MPTIHHSGRTIRVITRTAERVARAEADGATIIINSNWQFTGRGYSRVEKLAQTNNTTSGRPKHIIWACWR